MIIEFALAWLKSAGPLSKAFKLHGAQALFEEYLKRISHYSECRVKPLPEKTEAVGQLWICHPGQESKMLSSEALAQRLEKLRDSGTRRLTIAIGGPDGFPESGLKNLKPDFIWSFGPLTLPHELAAVVAAEQIYRAWTILHGLPYHKGH